MVDRLPIDTKFVLNLCDEANRILNSQNGQLLNIMEVEALLVALYNLNEYTPPLWRELDNPPNKDVSTD